MSVYIYNNWYNKQHTNILSILLTEFSEVWMQISLDNECNDLHNSNTMFLDMNDLLAPVSKSI